MRTADGIDILGPAEGDAFAGDIVVKARAAQTGGRWGVAVVAGVPGEGGRTHVHEGEAEGFLILEGRVELLGAESVTPLEPGAFVLVPADTEHGIRVVGDGPARWLAVWPSRLDGLPEDLAGAYGADERATISRRHGVIPGRDRRRR